MMRVVLVNPVHQKVAVIRGVAHTSPPLGLCYYASILRRAGDTVSIIDCVGEDLSVMDAVGRIMSDRPDSVGISVESLGLPYVRELVRVLKRCGMDVFLGGPHVKNEPSIAKILDAPIRPGFDDFGGVHGVSPKMRARLDDLPSPAYTLTNLNRYKYVASLSSIGCPLSCVYCNMCNSRLDLKSPEKVFGELSHLKRIGVSFIEFVDPVFALDRDHALNVLEKIRSLGLNWVCSMRADLIDRELLACMKKAGCWQVMIRVETGSEELRKELGKPIANSIYENAFRVCSELKIRTRACAMTGLPGDDEDSLKQSMDFLPSLGASHLHLTRLILFPGTVLFDKAVREGIIPNTVWADYALGKSGYPVLPYAGGEAELAVWEKRVGDKFYDENWLMRRLVESRNLDDIIEVLAVKIRRRGNGSP